MIIPGEPLRHNPKPLVRNSIDRVPSLRMGQIQEISLNNTFDTCDDRSDDEELVV